MANQKGAINKVFGIGLSHTGTRSLNEALNTLSIKSIHLPTDRQTYYELLNGIYKLSVLEKYQAITDITTVPIYPQLDKAYPGSKFILTVRDRESWFESMKRINKYWLKHSEQSKLLRYWRSLLKESRDCGRMKFVLGARFLQFLKKVKCRMRLFEFLSAATYGGFAFNDEERLLYVYDLHYKNVLDYFKERPNDLLIMNICNGDGWDLLCRFLSKPVPNIPFPHTTARDGIFTNASSQDTPSFNGSDCRE